MLDYCMCPKCERMIMLDSDFETGFCLYCGTHISYRDSREFLLEGLKSAVPDDMKIEADLSGASLSVDEITERSRRMQEIIDALDEKEMRWLELSEKEQ